MRAPPSQLLPCRLVQEDGILLLVNLVNLVNPTPQRPLKRFSFMDFPGACSTPSARLHGSAGHNPGPEDGDVLGRPSDWARRGLIVEGYLPALRKPANRARFPLSYVPSRGQLAGTDP